MCLGINYPELLLMANCIAVLIAQLPSSGKKRQFEASAIQDPASRIQRQHHVSSASIKDPASSIHHRNKGIIRAIRFFICAIPPAL